MKHLTDGGNPATEQFTPTQLDRFYALSSIYGSKAADLVPLLKVGKGPNSFAKVLDKAQTVNKARGVQKEYDYALTVGFGDWAVLTIPEIVRIVTEERANADLPPLVSRIRTSSLNEFFRLYIFEEVFDENEDGSKGDLVGYKALFRLLAD